MRTQVDMTPEVISIEAAFILKTEGHDAVIKKRRSKQHLEVDTKM